MIKFDDEFEIFAHSGLTSFKRDVDITFVRKKKKEEETERKESLIFSVVA